MTTPMAAPAPECRQCYATVADPCLHCSWRDQLAHHEGHPALCSECAGEGYDICPCGRVFFDDDDTSIPYTTTCGVCERVNAAAQLTRSLSGNMFVAIGYRDLPTLENVRW